MLVEKINIIEQEKAEKVKDIDDKILVKTNELDQYASTTQWGMHETLWEEISQYITSLLYVSINLWY